MIRDEFKREFSLEELERALGKIEVGKKGGADGIETAFFKHLPSYGKG